MGEIFFVEEVGFQTHDHSLQARVLLRIVPWCVGN
jgi:hypothetical protein